jgi:hypothetical protein
MPPRGHPAIHGLISASDVDELADRLAQAQAPHDM